MVHPLSGQGPEDASDCFEDPLEQNKYMAPLACYRTYSYRENLFAEFEHLVEQGRRFDGLIIDLMQIGYSLPLEILVKFSYYGKRVLNPSGVMLFVKADGAVTFTRDDPSGGLTFNVYDSPFGIFARYPGLADYMCATIAGIDRRRLRGGSTLAGHILFTSIPVLTAEGAQIKNAFEVTPPNNWLLQGIDDYTSVELLTSVMEKQYNVPTDETLRLLQELEAERLIYPIFARIQFLSSCYHNHKSFRLGRYLVAIGLLTPNQLEELLEFQQEQGFGRNQKTLLGLLAVRRGYLNTRELEILLNDQYLYGGYHHSAEDGAKDAKLESVKDSMIGSLGATDAAGLLQSLSTGKKTGLLSIENRELVFVMSFSKGKPTHARLKKLTGYDAVVEFLVTWNEGIFVFRDKVTSEELDDDCALTKSLDRILLDAALYQDQIDSILSGLSGGRKAIFERVNEFEERWEELSAGPLKFEDACPVRDGDRQNVYLLSSLIDGLTTLDEIVACYDVWPSYMSIKAIKLLIDQRLIKIQQTSLFKPLAVFQSLAAELKKALGGAENGALLESSLHYVHGNSPARKRFHVDHEGSISINLNQVKKTGTSVSTVVLELRRWMEAYVSYCRRQLEPTLVDEIVDRIVHEV